MTLDEDSRPALPRHVKLKFDKARDLWVLLAPERVLVPDETSVEVLQMCDGAATLGGILDRLASKYAAPRDEIARDVNVMLGDLAAKGFLADHREVPT